MDLSTGSKSKLGAADISMEIFDDIEEEAAEFIIQSAHARALDARAAKKPDGTVEQRLDVLISLSRLRAQIMIRNVSMTFVFRTSRTSMD